MIKVLGKQVENRRRICFNTNARGRARQEAVGVICEYEKAADSRLRRMGPTETAAGLASVASGALRKGTQRNVVKEGKERKSA